MPALCKQPIFQPNEVEKGIITNHKHNKAQDIWL
jgi:hypothetical protein